MKSKIEQKIEKLLRSRKEFQKWAVNLYVRDYYVCKEIMFDKIKHPPKVSKDVPLNTLLNFDAHYCKTDDGFTEIEKRWKLNFLVANTCVRKALKEILKEIKSEDLRTKK
jgi:hypothetical protein